MKTVQWQLCTQWGEVQDGQPKLRKGSSIIGSNNAFCSRVDIIFIIVDYKHTWLLLCKKTLSLSFKAVHYINIFR